MLSTKFAVALLIGSTVSLASVGRSADEPVTPDFKDPTGICFRRIAWSENGRTNNRYEIVLAKPSSSLAKDMERVRDVESDGHVVKSPDLVPFKWYGVWIDGEHLSDEKGPDCSALPIINEK